MKIRVQMPRGVSSVSVGGQQYEVPEDGILELESPEHVGPLVAAGGTELDETGEPGRTSVLVGSDHFPALVEIVPGEEPRQLGSIVAETHARTGISADQWNALPGAIRDALIGMYIGTLTGAIGDVRGERQRAEDAIAEVARLRDELEAARAGGTAEPGPDDKPKFEEMTKAKINEWIVGNGGTEVTTGNHDAFVAAAEARWSELHQELDAD